MAVWRCADSWECPREQQRIMMNMKNKNIITLLSAVTWLLHAKSSMCSIFFNPYSNLGGLSPVPRTGVLLLPALTCLHTRRATVALDWETEDPR